MAKMDVRGQPGVSGADFHRSMSKSSELEVTAIIRLWALGELNAKLEG